MIAFIGVLITGLKSFSEAIGQIIAQHLGTFIVLCIFVSIVSFLAIAVAVENSQVVVINGIPSGGGSMLQSMWNSFLNIFK